MKLIRRDPDQVIYSLMIGFLLPMILIFIVKNYILSYVFLVLALSFLGGYFFYGFRIMEKKDLGIYLFLALFCGLFMPYIFSWIHELSHAITVIINGIDVTGIKVDYPMDGNTYFAEGTNFTNRESIAIWINLSGSLGSFPSAVIINRVAYKKIRFSIFLPLFMITIFRIVSECCGWIGGIGDYINGIDSGNDIYRVLYYLQLDELLIPMVPLIILGVLIFFLLALIVWFVGFNLIKRIREERITIKKNNQKELN